MQPGSSSSQSFEPKSFLKKSFARITQHMHTQAPSSLWIVWVLRVLGLWFACNAWVSLGYVAKYVHRFNAQVAHVGFLDHLPRISPMMAWAGFTLQGLLGLALIAARRRGGILVALWLLEAGLVLRNIFRSQNHHYLLILVMTLIVITHPWRAKPHAQHTSLAFLPRGLSWILATVYGCAALAKCNAKFLSGSVLASLQWFEGTPLSLVPHWAPTFLPLAALGAVLMQAALCFLHLFTWRKPITFVLGWIFHGSLLVLNPSQPINSFNWMVMAVYCFFLPQPWVDGIQSRVLAWQHSCSAFASHFASHCVSLCRWGCWALATGGFVSMACAWGLLGHKASAWFKDPVSPAWLWGMLACAALLGVGIGWPSPSDRDSSHSRLAALSGGLAWMLALLVWHTPSIDRIMAKSISAAPRIMGRTMLRKRFAHIPWPLAPLAPISHSQAASKYPHAQVRLLAEYATGYPTQPAIEPKVLIQAYGRLWKQAQATQLLKRQPKLAVSIGNIYANMLLSTGNHPKADAVMQQIAPHSMLSARFWQLQARLLFQQKKFQDSHAADRLALTLAHWPVPWVVDAVHRALKARNPDGAQWILDQKRRRFADSDPILVELADREGLRYPPEPPP